MRTSFIGRNRRNWNALAIHVAVVVSLCPGVVLAQSPAPPPGAGTEGDPYLISSLSHLDWMSTNCTGMVDVPSFGVYSLQNDIDASETTNWHGGAGFMPIPQFFGTFRGNGKAIRHLFVNRPGEYGVGLFRNIQSMATEPVCLVAGLSLLDCRVAGSERVGGLAGFSEARVDDCFVSGSISGAYTVAGLIGEIGSREVRDSHFAGMVSGTENVGGVVGYLSGGMVCDSYSAGVISGSRGVGGLLGCNGGGLVSNCYAMGSVSGSQAVGGLVGMHFAETITHCYAGGTVSGEDFVGGLVGRDYIGTVAGCYSAAAVSGNTGLGGLVGDNALGTVTGSYWDTNRSGCAASAGGMGKSTAAMTAVITFGDWDFDSVWGLEGAYPYLRHFTAFRLRYDAGPCGTVAGWPDQVVNTGCGGLPCTAVPDAGCSFTAWSDGVMTNTRVDVNIIGSLSVTSCFAVTLAPLGTPEPWLIQHGLTNETPAVAEGMDPDADGFSAWQEYQADTDPTSRLSKLEMTGLHVMPEGVLVDWQGGTQATQWLETCPSLGTGGSWRVLFTNRPPTAAAVSVMDLTPSTGPRFYRIKAGR